MLPFPFDQIEDLISDLFRDVINTVLDIPRRIIDFFGPLLRDIRNAVSGQFGILLTQIKSVVSDVVNTLLGGLAGLPATIANLLGGIKATIEPFFANVIVRVANVVNTVTTSIRNFILPILANLRQTVTRFFLSIQSGLSAIGSTIQQAIAPILDSVWRNIQNLPTIIRSQLTSVQAFLSGGLNALLSQADANFRTLFEQTSRAQVPLSNLFVAFEEFGTEVQQQFANLGNISSTLASGLVSGFQFVFNGIKTAIIDPLLASITSLPDVLRQLIKPRGSITPEEARAELNTLGPIVLAAYAGVNTVAAIGEFFSFGQYDEVFRGIIDTLDDIGVDVFATDFVTFDYEVGVKPALTREVLKRYTPLVPGAGDLVRMVVRESFVDSFRTPAPKLFADFMEEQGFNVFWSDTFWTAHWVPLPFETSVTMFHRGIIDREDLLRRLIILDFRPTDATLLQELIFKLPNRIEARLMARFGLLSNDQLDEIIRAEGVRSDFVEPLRKMMQEFSLTRIFTRTESTAISASEDGLITDAEFQSMMEQVKRPPGVIAADIELGRFKRLLDFKRFQIKTVETSMKRGQITIEEGMTALQELGLDSERITIVVARIQFDLDFKVSKKVKGAAPQLTTSQIISALKKEQISVEDTLEAILAKGYDSEQAQLLINTALA